MFSSLNFLKAPRPLTFIVFAFLFFDLAHTQVHETNQNSNYSNNVYTKTEKAAEDQERKQLQSFVVELLKDYGCKDFEKKAFEAILEQLRKNSQPRLNFRERHKLMVNNLRVYNK